ncbi:MAG TPA: PadR family transcriptional regulator [Acidimicrobiales bacterium]|nr:PadR family transcriptional regulator [Acidimicrobiales bacterium]
MLTVPAPPDVGARQTAVLAAPWRMDDIDELAHLEDLGLVQGTELSNERYPNKRVFSTTEQGEAVLQRWLDESPVGEDRVRNQFLVRIFFGDRVSAERLGSLLDAYEAAATARRDHYAQVVATLADRPQSRFRAATAMYGVSQQQAQIDWVAEVRALLVGPVPSQSS